VSVPLNGVDACTIALAPVGDAGHAEDDITRFQEAARQAPQVLPYWERLGWAFVARARRSFDPGFYTLAEHTARCIEAKHPENAEAMVLRGHVLHNLHRFREAEGLARHLVVTRGLWFEYGLLGDVLMEQGQLTEAIEAYAQMMEQKPGPQAYVRAAHVRWLTGDLDGAVEAMQMAARGFRDAESLAWAQVRLALYALQGNHVPRAFAHLAGALAAQPDYAPALLARGRVFLAIDQPVEAIASLERAAQRNPLPEYQWVLIEALHAAGRTQAARAIDSQLRQRGALNDRRTLALYLATVGHDINTALQLAEAELETRADVFTLDTLAWALNTAGRHQDARAFSQRAVAEGTQDARLFYHAGVIALAVGQHDEAAGWFAMAISLRQMLMPSERQHLADISAALPPQSSALAVRPAPRLEPLIHHSERNTP
jgi:tetratricopeptide (TPR) repeat protein